MRTLASAYAICVGIIGVEFFMYLESVSGEAYRLWQNVVHIARLRGDLQGHEPATMECSTNASLVLGRRRRLFAVQNKSFHINQDKSLKRDKIKLKHKV